MPSGQMEQQVNLKFLVKLGKTATEAYAMLKEVYGNECLSRTQVLEWFKRFKERHETTEDDPRPGRPSKTDDNIEKIDKLILEDRLSIRVKSALKEPRFESVEAVKAKATEVLNQLTDFQHRFQKWESRMERCRDHQGH
ncbi:hypothetical protein LAZ67_13003334 [Cordylochernes scorpioides]|uniref:Mos1 transposase HTH domain-containing protein n=1 Tax=Cordylochernes scorpioides TaxID=51811 RepID=A0ABY6L793_9ARAC|nr:hypothetical protein LAZ67_13003334 [Cordylochernes scorpioides]